MGSRNSPDDADAAVQHRARTSPRSRADKPEKSLTERDPQDRRPEQLRHVIDALAIGGGHKRRYRIVDFHRDKHGIPAKVAAIEYDPNRSARIALLHYADGEKRYIMAPDGLKVGDTVMSGPDADIAVGQLPAAREHSARHRRAQRRAGPGQGRASGAGGRRVAS